MKLSLRWKLLTLLAAIALGPLYFIAWTDLRTLSDLGSTLAGQSAEALGAQLRANLRQLADSHAAAIERQRRLVELILRLQARDIEDALRNPQLPPLLPVWASGFDGPRPPPGVRRDVPGYYRQLDAEHREPLALSFDTLSFHRAPGVAEEAVLDDARRLAALAPRLRALRATAPDLVYWQYASLASGLHASHPAHGGYPASYDARLRDWYRRQETRQALDWSPPHTDVGTRLPVISATLPLRDAGGRFIGVTGIDLRVTALLRALELPRHVADASRVLLTRLEADELRVLAHNDHRELGGDWQEAPAPERLRFDRAADLAALRADMRAGNNGLRSFAVGGERQLCVYRKLDDDGLYLVFLVASHAATRPAQDAADYALTTTRRQQDALLLIACIVAVGVGALSFAAARAVTGPVESLERAVGAVAEGDFSTRVEIRTGDELETLGESFNAMIPRLEAHTRVQESLALAREVQQQLLPGTAPQFPGLDVAGSSLYCDETGGDYYDFFDLREVGRNTLGAVIGDVSGHGVAAALLMATARALLHGAAGSAAVTPAAMIADLNRLLAADVRPGHYLTLFALFVDLDARSFDWSSAGHDAALCWRADTRSVVDLAGDDIPLGIDRAWQFHASRRAPFAPGDVVMLTTDGLWETQAPDGERFGKPRLRELLREHHEVLAAELARLVLRAVACFRGDAVQRDDMTVVIVRVTGAGHANPQDA